MTDHAATKCPMCRTDLYGPQPFRIDEGTPQYWDEYFEKHPSQAPSDASSSEESESDEEPPEKRTKRFGVSRRWEDFNRATTEEECYDIANKYMRHNMSPIMKNQIQLEYDKCLERIRAEEEMYRNMVETNERNKYRWYKYYIFNGNLTISIW